MEPILDSFEQVVRTMKLAPPRLPIVSCMTGEIVQARLTDPRYWREHLRQPVRFAAGMQTLFKQGCTIFIEIGPKPTLLSMAEQCLDQEKTNQPKRSNIML